MKRVRCSTLPLFMACTHSVLNPEGFPEVRPYNDAAELGTGVHGVMERLLLHGEVNAEQLYLEFPDERKRIDQLITNIIEIWESASKVMKKPVVEEYLEAEIAPGLTLTGHIDVHSVDHPGKQGTVTAYVLDYKTGRVHDEHYHQLMGYAYLVWDKLGRPDGYQCYMSAAYAEDKSIHPYYAHAEDLKLWAERVAKRVTDPAEHLYSPSRKCAYCPLLGSCKAANEFVAGAARVITQGHISQTGLADMTPEQIEEVDSARKVLSTAIDRWRMGIRNYVERHNSPLPLGSSHQYELVERPMGTKVDTAKAIPVLVEFGLFDRQLAKELKRKEKAGELLTDGLQVTLTQVTKAYADRAARGRKTEAKRELIQALRDAGALEEITVRRLERRPINEEVLDAPEEDDD